MTRPIGYTTCIAISEKRILWQLFWGARVIEWSVMLARLFYRVFNA